MLSFPHSLGSNNLAGETDYINKSEVQGSSFEVGAKVTYEGREMTVSQAPDSDGDIKMMDLSGVMALAASLPECGLTSLECAAPKCLPLCQRPLTLLAPVWQLGREQALRRQQVRQRHLHHRGHHQAVQGAQGEQRDLAQVRTAP